MPECFKDVTWTFNDYRHAEHCQMEGPPLNKLAMTRPSSISLDNNRREALITLLTMGLCGSYVAFYIELRVASCWVPFSVLCTIWLESAYCSLQNGNFLVKKLGSTLDKEHWIAMFHDTLSESMLATLQHAQAGPARVQNEKRGIQTWSWTRIRHKQTW